MRNDDQTIRDALRKAQGVLCHYLEPNGPNENQTVKQLFGILNDPEVIRALERALKDLPRLTAFALLPIPALCPDKAAAAQRLLPTRGAMPSPRWPPARRQ
jgi:hypothetical protein